MLSLSVISLLFSILLFLQGVETKLFCMYRCIYKTFVFIIHIYGSFLIKAVLF